MDKRTDILLPLIFGSMIALCVALWNISSFRPHPAPRADILIFSPHPDDSVLCCAGVIRQALEAHKTVLVVNITHGDDFASAAALLFHKPIHRLTPQDMVNLGRTRQIEDMKALQSLGLPTNQVLYLGYPDAALDETLKSDDVPYLHWNTLKSATYGLRRRDYHTNRYGGPALFMTQSATGDIAEIINDMNSEEIYVTSPHDTALDHNAAYWLVYEALKQTDFSGQIYTYVIHAPDWPNPPETTPNQPFSPIGVTNGVWQSTDLPWTTRDIFAAINTSPILPIHIPLTPQQAAIKYEAISRYRSQIAPDDYPLFGFVKNEEVFW